MEEPTSSLFERAIELWDKGELLATFLEGNRSSLYSYNNQFFIIWYDVDNSLEQIEEIKKDAALKLLKEYIAKTKDYH